MRHVGGQMQQSSAAAATALYENGGAGVSGGDAGDAVMARWLQSAGLQHLASPMVSNPVDQRLLPNLLMQVKIMSVYTICFLQIENGYFMPRCRSLVGKCFSCVIRNFFWVIGMCKSFDENFVVQSWHSPLEFYTGF